MSSCQTLDFSQLKITLSGGMATEPHVAKRWYGVTGCHITQAWGLTETSPGACSNFPGKPFNGSVGLPMPSTEIAIKGETGGDLPLGEVGEICVRGPQVTPGYWQRPEDSARAFWPGAWLRTGDIGRFDEEGFVYLIERLKDVIVVSGFKVYPQEVEAVAATYPGVLETAATAQPDGASGESVALFVVCTDEVIDKAKLIAHCHRSRPLQSSQVRLCLSSTTQVCRRKSPTQHVARGTLEATRGVVRATNTGSDV